MSKIEFATLKAAKAADFHEPLPEEYGGEEVVVKRHRLVRKCNIALSTNAWDQLGYRVLPDAVPHASVHRYRLGHHDVYRRDQVVEKKQLNHQPPVALPLTRESILEAAYVVNQSAKRYRDGAHKAYRKGNHGQAGQCRTLKERFYELKDCAIAEAYGEGWLTPETLHGGLVLYSGDGYCFHSRLLPEGLELPVEENAVTFFREARPAEKGHMRVCDAVATLQQLGQPAGFRILAPPLVPTPDREIAEVDRPGPSEIDFCEPSESEYEDEYNRLFGEQTHSHPV